MTLSRQYTQLWIKRDACDFMFCVLNHGAPQLSWSEPPLPLTEKRAQSPFCHLLPTMPSMASHGPQDGMARSWTEQFPGHSCFDLSLSPLPAVLPPPFRGRQVFTHVHSCAPFSLDKSLPQAADCHLMLVPRLLSAPQLPSIAQDWPFCEILCTLQSQSQMSTLLWKPLLAPRQNLLLSLMCP